MTDLLSDEEIERQLPPGWSRDGDEVIRVYAFDEYLRGVNFAQMVGEIAEAKNHHPTMVISYGQLEVRFTSHEEGGITDRDIEMARIVENELDSAGGGDSL